MKRAYQEIQHCTVALAHCSAIGHTADITPPSAPTDVRAVETTPAAAWVGWTAAIDDTGVTLTATKNPDATGTQFGAEVSSGMIVWTNDVTVLESDLTTFKARDNIPVSSAARRFMRLKVTAP